APKWQDKLRDMLAGSTATEAWGLFSSGGWSDAGQVMVLMAKDNQAPHLAVVPPAKKAISGERELTGAETEAVSAAVKKAAGLQDVNEQVFDTIEFELVHMGKGADGKPEVTQRVYVRQSGNVPHPEHDAVIQAFQKLRGT